MNARSFVTMFLLLWVAVPNFLNAQDGEFDDLILDGGVGGTPSIRFNQLDGDDHLIATTNDQLLFFLGGFKLLINESAENGAMILNDAGVNIRRGLKVTVDDDDDSSLVEGLHPLTGQTFSVNSFSETLDFTGGGGGIGLSTDSNDFPFLLFDSARIGSLSAREEGVGVGTIFADAPLHVFTNGNEFDAFPTARILVENESGVTAIREMFSLVNNGGSRFSFMDTDRDSTWSFASDSAGRFSIAINDTGGPEFVIQPDGRVLMGPGPHTEFRLEAFGESVFDRHVISVVR